MNAIAFDTLKFSKRLQAAGFTLEQAEAQAEAFSEAVSETLATRSDLDHAASLIQKDISQGTADLRSEIRDANIAMLKWIVPMLIGQTAVVAALVKLL
ncbi:MAG: hypothetical protein ABL874_05535 [Sphingopyxis sp.]